MKNTRSEERAFISRLRTLHKISSATSSSDIDRIDLALRFVLDELGLDQGYLGAIDEPTNELVIQKVVACRGEPTYAQGKRYPLDQTLIGRVIHSEEVLAAHDVVEARNEYAITYTDEWKSYIAVAIRFGGRCYGVIGFKGRTVREQRFSEIDTEFVQIAGDLIAASVDRKQQRERLDTLAFYDSLTGLPNRVLFADRLTQCIITAKRSEGRFALFFLDLDGFKGINDMFGHAAGDDVLRQFAARLTGIGREGDTVARLGGDEFVILAPNIEIDRYPLELAARLAESAGRPMLVDGRSCTLSVSIGISLFPDNGSDASTLLKGADAAMFDAKSHGNNCVRFARDVPKVAAMPDLSGHSDEQWETRVQA